SNIKCVLLYLAGVFLTFGHKIVVEYYNFKVNGEMVNEGSLIKYTSPTMVLCATALLCLFAKVRFKDGMKKLTATFSPYAFSVYLIHTAPFVWSKVMKNRFELYAEFNPILMLLAVFGTAIGIFLLCSLIDFVRIKIFRILKIKELSLKLEDAINNFQYKKSETTKI
ncbi:MAG: hypothetical protein IJZ16_02430, partial [Clostridia bacterium]|nr:hypothetical protein [Clostridia bacterium]